MSTNLIGKGGGAGFHQQAGELSVLLSFHHGHTEGTAPLHLNGKKIIKPTDRAVPILWLHL